MASRPLSNSPYDRPHALLAYLAVESDRPHRREALADLFWPDLPAEAARHNLRQLLFTLRRTLGDPDAAVPFLLVGRDTVRFNRAGDYWLDIEAFAAPLPPCMSAQGPVGCRACLERMEQAAGLYRGPLMEQCALAGHTEFEAWLLAKREALHQHALALLERLVDCHERNGDPARAARFALRYVELEPWSEEGHRKLMRLLALGGQRGAALAQYEACSRILTRELGAAPDEHTRQLYERIRTGEPLEAVRQAHAELSVFATAERRQVTVLCCEPVPPEGADPEDVSELLHEAQQYCLGRIRRAGGRAAPSHGGGALAYFGYPEAREDAARQAVRTALGLTQDGEQPVVIRAGVHTGFIITRGTVDAPDTVGFTSNIAIRLRDLAAAGEVLVSAATLRLVRALFRCEPLGPVVLQGATGPLEAFRVMGETGSVNLLDAAERLTPLAGREAELARLFALWEEAASGHTCVVLLQGEPGIGKSRLARALKERLAGGNGVVRELRCLPEFQGSALYPLVELLRRIIGLRSNDAPHAKLVRLKDYLGQFPSPVREAAPLLAPLLDIPLDSRHPGAELAPHVQRSRTQEAVLALLDARAARQPMLWILEDVQWADPSTLELIELLMRQERAAPVLGVLTARPEFEHPRIGRCHIKLGPLPPEAASHMVTSVADGAELPSEAARAIVQAADGVPLFIEEMTRAMLESVGGQAAPAVPATLQDLLMMRLDRLGPAKRLAQLGAVLGREFSHALLAAVCELDEDALNWAVPQLLGSGLLFAHETPAGVEYRFKHALVQEAAYQSQPKRDRQAAHRRIAEILQASFGESIEQQPELMAQHLTGASENRQAIDWWLRAGRRALGRHANMEAMAHLQTGLALLEALPADPERDHLELELQLALGSSLLNVRGYGAIEVQQAYGRAMALCRESGETDEIFQTLWGLFMGASTRSGYREAKEIAQQMLRIAESEDNPVLRIGAHYAIGNTLFWTGEFTEAVLHQERAAAFYAPEHKDELILRYGENPSAASLSFMAWSLWFLGYPDQALAKAQEAVAFARALADPPTLALTLTFASLLYRLRREPEQAQAAAQEVLQVAGRQELMFWTASGLALHGWSRVMAGDESGVAEINRSLDGMRQAMGGAGVSFLAVLAEAHERLRQPEAGLAVVAEALAIADAIADRYFEADLHRLRGEFLLMLSPDNGDEVERCFLRALGISRRQAAKVPELRAALSYAHLLRGQGNTERAREILAPVYGWFAEGLDTMDLQQARALLADLSSYTLKH